MLQNYSCNTPSNTLFHVSAAKFGQNFANFGDKWPSLDQKVKVSASNDVATADRHWLKRTAESGDRCKSNTQNIFR